MTVLEWLIAMEDAGATDIWREGNTICTLRDRTHGNIRRIEQLQILAIKCGLKDKLLPMLVKVPAECEVPK